MHDLVVGLSTFIAVLFGATNFICCERHIYPYSVGIHLPGFAALLFLLPATNSAPSAVGNGPWAWFHIIILAGAAALGLIARKIASA